MLVLPYPKSTYRKWIEAGNRRHEYNASAAALLEQRLGLLGQQKCCLHVDLEDLVPCLLAGVEHRSDGRTDGSIRHQDVDTAEALARLRKQIGALLAAGHVTLNAQHIGQTSGVQLGNGALHVRHFPAADDHIGTVAGQSLGDRQADAVRMQSVDGVVYYDLCSIILVLAPHTYPSVEAVTTATLPASRFPVTAAFTAVALFILLATVLICRAKIRFIPLYNHDCSAQVEIIILREVLFTLYHGVSVDW